MSDIRFFSKGNVAGLAFDKSIFNYKGFIALVKPVVELGNKDKVKLRFAIDSGSCKLFVG